MQICMLIYYYWPVQAGGAENQCRRLSAALTAQGHTCTVLTTRQKFADPAQEREKSGVCIIRKPTLETLLQKIRVIQATRQAAQREKRTKTTETASQQQDNFSDRFIERWREKLASFATYTVRYCNIIVFVLGVIFFLRKNRHTLDILHVHTADWIAGVAAFSGKIFKIPVVCKGADMPVFPPLQAVPMAACCDIWRKKAHFIALTQAMRADLIQNNVSGQHITVIPNGVLLPEQTTSVEENNDFLYIGNFSQSAAHKSFDILIEAWAKVHRLRPDIKLFMLGGGNADEWTALADSLGCDDSIDFLGYRKKITPFFLQTCCLLLPSRKEGISNALLEAQSFGLPAIVSDIPGNREIVLHEINGLIVPVENSDALAVACINMFDNPLLREKYGYAARKRIEELYSMERIANLTVNLYKKLLHGAKV